MVIKHILTVRRIHNTCLKANLNYGVLPHCAMCEMAESTEYPCTGTFKQTRKSYTRGQKMDVVKRYLLNGCNLYRSYMPAVQPEYKNSIKVGKEPEYHMVWYFIKHNSIVSSILFDTICDLSCRTCPTMVPSFITLIA